MARGGVVFSRLAAWGGHQRGGIAFLLGSELRPGSDRPRGASSAEHCGRTKLVLFSLSLR